MTIHHPDWMDRDPSGPGRTHTVQWGPYKCRPCGGSSHTPHRARHQVYLHNVSKEIVLCSKCECETDSPRDIRQSQGQSYLLRVNSTMSGGATIVVAFFRQGLRTVFVGFYGS